MTGTVQVLRQGTGHVCKAAGLGEWLDLRGEKADRESFWHGGADLGQRWSGYDEAMRRLLIGLTVTLLVVVSIGVGVAIALWPHSSFWR